jgi:protein phosphatase
MKMNIAQKTDVGRQRKDNQDNMSWLSLGGGELFIVADGMGGEAGGRMAADMAIAAIKESFEKEGLPVIQLLKTSIEEANSRIHAKGTSGDLKFHRMGTTVVVLFIKDDKAYIAHIGDSRIYRYRMGTLERLTKDHSQVQQLVDMGIIKPEDTEDHPDANVITRSLGSKPVVEVDIRPEPETILPGDKFLLCTDGLSSLVSDREIQAILNQERPVNETCDLLIQTALNKGGHDNVTVQLISFDGQHPQGLLTKKSLKPDRLSFNNKTIIMTGVAAVALIALILFLILLISDTE